MATVTDQDTQHPLYPLLDQFFESRKINSTSHVRLWQPGKTRSDTSDKLSICWSILRRGVQRWQALTEEEKDYYRDNAPPRLPSGYMWFLWIDIIQNYGGGPWTVEDSQVQGHSYIVPQTAPQGVQTFVYIGASIIGSKSLISP